MKSSKYQTVGPMCSYTMQHLGLNEYLHLCFSLCTETSSQLFSDKSPEISLTGMQDGIWDLDMPVKRKENDDNYTAMSPQSTSHTACIQTGM